MIRILSWLVLLVAIGGGAWWLDTWIVAQGWATLDGGTWEVTANGWPLLFRTWPIALLGAMVAVVVIWWFLDRAAEARALADYHRHREALDDEQTKLAALRGRLNIRAVELTRQDAEAKAIRDRAEADLAEARRQVEHADRRVAKEIRRRAGAVAAAKRLRRA